MDVSFGDPGRLYALWGLVPLALLLLHGRRRRERAAAALLDAPMRARLSPARRGVRGALPGILSVVGLALLVVAAARPRFGTVYEKVQQRGADLVVVLDVSRSMLSRDVHPSRLERSKAYVRDLLARAGGHRVGLVVFAGRPVVACPMTADLAFFESVLADVSPDSAPRGGTVIGDAIRRAVDVLDPMPDRDQAFVLITDGEDQDSFPLEAAAVAAERGVRIFTVGIGDPDEGARIPLDEDDAAGRARFVRFEGEDVVSRMDEELLQEIARETRGAYVPARTGTYDLGEVYVEHLSNLRAGALREEERRRQREQFQLFAGLALAFLLASMLVRPTDRRPAVVAAALLLGLAVAPPSAAAEDR
ncbi:MAG: VWA domain-containing protein, partial [Planctomycetota bacterium JB042]